MPQNLLNTSTTQQRQILNKKQSVDNRALGLGSMVTYGSQYMQENYQELPIQKKSQMNNGRPRSVIVGQKRTPNLSYHQSMLPPNEIDYQYADAHAGTYNRHDDPPTRHPMHYNNILNTDSELHSLVNTHYQRPDDSKNVVSKQYEFNNLSSVGQLTNVEVSDPYGSNQKQRKLYYPERS